MTSNLKIISIIVVIIGISLFGIYSELFDGRSDEEISSNEQYDDKDIPQSKKTAIKRGVPARTNSWFSSLNVKFPSTPLFVFPGAYSFDKNGINISYSNVHPTPNTVFGSFNALCSAGNGKEVISADIERYGDWDIVVKVGVRNGSAWRAHLMQGSPVVQLSNVSDELSLQCSNTAIIPHGSDSVVVSQSGKELFLVQAKNGTINVSGGNTQLTSSEGVYRIIQLPEDKTITMDFFQGLYWSQIQDTQVTMSGLDDSENTELSVVTDDESSVLMTVWPHHQLGSVSNQQSTIGTYHTIYGDLRLIFASSIRITHPKPDLPMTFDPVVSDVAREKVRSAILYDVQRFQNEVPPAGVYFRGAWLGSLASTIQLADVYGMTNEKEELLDILEKHFLESLDQFTYDPVSKMVVAKNTEFGNEKGNDHHFHYGYYLRTGAILLSYRDNLENTIKPVLNELASDIGNTDRANSEFPFLRHFSPYEGHSWADGVGLFDDGNNQESSSEALNAWYGLYLWGNVSHNQTFSNTGSWLFSQELSGTKAYWFGENNPFPLGYQHKLISMVWGGKRDFATWFSADPMHIHGIQWLPITPVSKYLSSLPYATERLSEIRLTHPHPESHEWGDLYTAYVSFVDPSQAQKMIGAAEKTSAMGSRALLYHTVYKNLER